VDALDVAASPAVLRDYVRTHVPGVTKDVAEEIAQEMALLIVERQSRGKFMRLMWQYTIDAARRVTRCERMEERCVARSPLLWYSSGSDAGVIERERLTERWLDEETEDQVAEWLSASPTERGRRRAEAKAALVLAG